MAEEELTTHNILSEERLGNLSRYLDVPYRIVIEFGRTKMTVRDILNLTCDSVVSIPKSAGENVDVLANDKVIAHGEIITIEESNGVIITDIASE